LTPPSHPHAPPPPTPTPPMLRFRRCVPRAAATQHRNRNMESGGRERGNEHTTRARWGHHEEDRVPLLRPLVGLTRLGHPHSLGCAAAVDRPRRRRGGARCRRRLLPRAPLRAPT